LTINDNTEVVAYDPGGALDLRARAWPFGEADVLLRWQESAPGSSRVRMEEHLVGGPAVALRNKLSDAVLHVRNDESLARLEHLTRKYSVRV
jgi:hypothetical protein